MLIRPDKDVAGAAKPGSRVPAGGWREARVLGPGCQREVVPAAGERKAYSCTNFVHWASS